MAYRFATQSNGILRRISVLIFLASLASSPLLVRAQTLTLPADEAIRPLLDGRFAFILVSDELMGPNHEQLTAAYGDPGEHDGESFSLDAELADAFGTWLEKAEGLSVWMIGPDGPCRSDVVGPVFLAGRGSHDQPFTLALQLEPCTAEPAPLVFLSEDMPTNVVWRAASTREWAYLPAGVETFSELLAQRLRVVDDSSPAADATDGSLEEGTDRTDVTDGTERVCVLVEHTVGAVETLATVFTDQPLPDFRDVAIITTSGWIEIPFRHASGALYSNGRVVLAVAEAEGALDTARSSAWGLATARRLSAKQFEEPQIIPTHFSSGEFSPPHPFVDERHPLYRRECVD